MSARQRLTFAAVAVAIAIAAVVLLATGGGSGETTATQPTDATTAERTPEPDPATRQEEAEPQPTPAPRPERRVPRIVVRDGEPRGGVRELRVEQGDRVRFSVVSDAADHVHVHGYDVLRDVSPGQAAGFDFEADITGVFEVELEERGVQVASLRVDP